MLVPMEDLVYVYLPKILLAIFCGSLIGLERELKEKPAGIKTYMLICTGATLFTIISIAFSDFYGVFHDALVHTKADLQKAATTRLIIKIVHFYS